MATSSHERNLACRTVRARLFRPLHGIGVCVCAMLVAALSTAALGQPRSSTTPVILVVPFAAGGSLDAVARLLAPQLQSKLNQPVVVDNKAGDGGALGAQFVARARPDGHTLLLATTDVLLLRPESGTKLPFRVEKDFSPIVELASMSYVLLVAPDSPSGSVGDLLSGAQSKELKIGSQAPGTAGYLAAEAFASAGKIKSIHVPYRDSASTLADLSSGVVDVAFASVGAALPHIKAGTLKALAVSSASRTPLLPGVQTLAESGFPAPPIDIGIGVFGPGGMSRDTITAYNRQMNEVLRSPELQRKLADLGYVPVGAGAEQFERKLRSDTLQSAVLAGRTQAMSVSGAPSGPVSVPSIVGGAPPAAAAPAPPAAAAAAPMSPTPPPDPPARAAPPVAMAPPHPLPTPVDLSGNQRPPPIVAFWNAWFERDGKVSNRLAVDTAYTFVLDLSRYQRRPEAGAPVSKEAGKILDAAVHSTRFTIRLLFTGGTVRPTETQGPSASVPLSVYTPRLRSEGLTPNELVAWRDGKLTSDVYLSRASAGYARFDVMTVGEGCGTVAISVWDDTGLRPLDHLAYQYAVGNPQTCAQHDRLTAGIGTMLALSSSPAAGQAIAEADAALHIFDVPLGARDRGSVVWYVDRAELKAGSAQAPGIYAWQTQSSLKNYIQTPTQLPAMVRDAREAAASARDWPYAKVAEDLRKKLFSVENERRYGADARRAQAALEKMVNDSTQTPVIVARLAVSADTLDYLPLSLLAARAEKPFLSKQFVTVQPLRRERLRQEGTCVGPWTLGIPTKLSGIDGEIESDLAGFALPDPKWPLSWSRDMEHLRSGFKARSGPYGAANSVAAKADTPGEGVVLLSHHSEGNLWFDDPLDKLVQEDFQRELGRGSVAVIAACSIGGSSPLSYKLIDQLNERNVDTMILSPFEVDAPFGARLAMNFVREIDSALRNNTGDAVVDVFGRAWAETEKYFQRTIARDFHDMRLEFVVLGDPDARLCKR
ncbi:tripartite tricarboxylate transporter substrate binding protein [uncultured Pseudacidovorax sp.]|uniref:Bug family tripartite tricarboxylate transporter substrate binding protein n=1 Tax=uncultured Pseudacidovorax sp. TaxID=679313 RepID=UPI0025CDEDC2|nr:tripartite tricarboxylate transporter substrate binding protein [uncultured Pseudacidovorax sp.]